MKGLRVLRCPAVRVLPLALLCCALAAPALAGPKKKQPPKPAPVPAEKLISQAGQENAARTRLEEEIAGLKAALETLRIELDEKEAMYGELEQDRAALEAAYNDLEQESRTQGAEAATQKKLVAELTDQLAEIEKRPKFDPEQEKQLRLAREELEKTRKLVDGLQRLIDSVQDPEALIKRVRQLEADLAEERSRARAAESLANELESALNEDLRKLSADESAAELLKARQKVSHLESELSGIRLKLLDAYAQGERLEAEVLKLRGKVTQEKGESLLKSQEVEQARLAAIRQTAELQQQLAEREEQQKRMQELLDRLDTQRADLQTQLAITRAEMQEAIQKGWQSSDSERSLREQLRTQQERSENLRDKLRQREEDVEEMTRERLHALASSVEARETLDAMQSEVNVVFARLVNLREKLRSCDPRALTALAEQFRERTSLVERMKVLREVLELPSE
ncbi:hypothetical protein DYH09_06720 [bacterium CPR1]|nr:hypothetical protein [bacterium CPR1]